MSSHPKDAEGFYRLAQLDQVPDEDMLQVMMEDDGVEVDIALAMVDGQVYAFRDICPHMAFPLSIGYLEGTKLTCVGHAWTFDIKSGRALMPPIKKNLALYETKLDGENNVWVKVDPLF